MLLVFTVSVVEVDAVARRDADHAFGPVKD